ncbi:MAG TPA: hypothetical protein DCQ26_14000 [Marinilabiliales bacterium]|jgi:hypothetical protein|nr:MAG: hypothetical protein A2W95_00120 [Bacteroidetes bacterium GWA2_40_14]OFX57460.1 MAG: hypothetical protein A2W84_06165 [Bacteroidetes bacterium GWC2_40_13]OFX71684.1 MAG: hypothetical protein A2W96_09925 [Bacteroidetes bacterium GWD2_40_43]OFX90223.1 MAG: hypothetical protein A2W97_17110 [Bacteroidetes bacterium GWE2_40_63]OFY18631.1 MAG: hypothetical protein A2W88_05155 [Bacteroidetes bacterium GWF2_40_13]OFZ27685.1 MAG: hypothetical protein A2437_01835 [Bacteroidetes bacterium RIFOXYC
MNDKGKAFIAKLDELIELFKQLRDKATSEGIIIKNDPLYQNFELLAGNYQMIKNTIPDDFIEEMGEPIKELITQMVDQLKKDLGIFDKPEAAPVIDERENIDFLLKNRDLSEQEINDLLDKRRMLEKKNFS